MNEKIKLSSHTKFGNEIVYLHDSFRFSGYYKTDADDQIKRLYR